jgi:hypothetical protein
VVVMVGDVGLRSHRRHSYAIGEVERGRKTDAICSALRRAAAAAATGQRRNRARCQRHLADKVISRVGHDEDVICFDSARWFVKESSAAHAVGVASNNAASAAAASHCRCGTRRDVHAADEAVQDVGNVQLAAVGAQRKPSGAPKRG